MVADHVARELIEIGANFVSHGRHVTFQMAEVAVPRDLPAHHAPILHGHIGREFANIVATRDTDWSWLIPE